MDQARDIWIRVSVLCSLDKTPDPEPRTAWPQDRHPLLCLPHPPPLWTWLPGGQASAGHLVCCSGSYTRHCIRGHRIRPADWLINTSAGQWLLPTSQVLSGATYTTFLIFCSELPCGTGVTRRGNWARGHPICPRASGQSGATSGHPPLLLALLKLHRNCRHDLAPSPSTPEIGGGLWGGHQSSF